MLWYTSGAGVIIAVLIQILHYPSLKELVNY